MKIDESKMQNCFPIDENHVMFLCCGNLYICDLYGSILFQKAFKYDYSYRIPEAIIPYLSNGTIYVENNCDVNVFDFVSVRQTNQSTEFTGLATFQDTLKSYFFDQDEQFRSWAGRCICLYDNNRGASVLREGGQPI